MSIVASMIFTSTAAAHAAVTPGVAPSAAVAAVGSGVNARRPVQNLFGRHRWAYCAVTTSVVAATPAPVAATSTSGPLATAMSVWEASSLAQSPSTTGISPLQRLGQPASVVRKLCATGQTRFSGLAVSEDVAFVSHRLMGCAPLVYLPRHAAIPPAMTGTAVAAVPAFAVRHTKRSSGRAT